MLTIKNTGGKLSLACKNTGDKRDANLETCPGNNSKNSENEKKEGEWKKSRSGERKIKGEGSSEKIIGKMFEKRRRGEKQGGKSNREKEV